MRETLAAYCMRTRRDALLRQWDALRNLPLTPDRISYGSRRRVWWVCEKGHQWQAAVYTRTSGGAQCPVCSGRVPLPGETDLAALYPELARQWHPTLNGADAPDQVRPGSHKTVWWVCEKGHVWQAQVRSRVMGCGCPVCAHRETAEDNTLSACFPQVAAQWHPVKNGALRPEDVLPGSRRKVWWQCEKGHQWQATVASRTAGGTGCPYCAGKRVTSGENDLVSLFPTVAAQWHPERNGTLRPWQVAPYASRKVWWRCERGHEYQAVVADRTMGGKGCPYCAGKRVLPGFNDLASREPDLAGQWHGALNGTLTPEMVTVGSHRRVWWKCPAGHVWKAAIYSRTGPKGCGCPVCAGKVSEKRLRTQEELRTAEI